VNATQTVMPGAVTANVVETDAHVMFVSSNAWRLPSTTVQESETSAVEKGAEEKKKVTTSNDANGTTDNNDRIDSEEP